MNKRIEKLKKFFEQYSEDYAEDGTKNVIIQKLDEGNIHVVENLLNTIDKEWLQEVQKRGSFRVFRNSVNMLKGQAKKMGKDGYYQTGYMGDFNTGETHIPVIRHVVPRIIEDVDINGERII